MPKLTDEERTEFLEEPGFALRLGCVRPDGTPLVVPISFMHKDGAIYFTPRAKSEWFDCLRKNPQVCLCIDELPQPMRKVIVEGEAQLVYDVGHDHEWRDLFLDMMRRYTTNEGAEYYVLDQTIDQQRGLYKVVLADSKVKTWRTPIGDEPETGIWHQRYYAPGTKFSNR